MSLRALSFSVPLLPNAKNKGALIRSRVATHNSLLITDLSASHSVSPPATSGSGWELCVCVCLTGLDGSVPVGFFLQPGSERQLYWHVHYFHGRIRKSQRGLTEKPQLKHSIFLTRNRDKEHREQRRSCRTSFTLFPGEASRDPRIRPRPCSVSAIHVGS